MMGNSISVVIPAYSEEKVIEQTIISVHKFLKENFSEFEIIIVDDNSKDATYDIVNKLSKQLDGIQLIRSDCNFGKGYAVRKGILFACLKNVAFVDADLSTPIQELSKCIPFLENGTDIVIGSRALHDSNILKYQGFLRRNMGKMFNIFVQLFLFMKISLLLITVQKLFFHKTSLGSVILPVRHEAATVAGLAK